MSPRTLMAALAAALALTACDRDSNEIPTEELFPRFEVRTNAAGSSEVSVSLATDVFLGRADLSGGDTVTVTGGSASGNAAPKATLQTGSAANTPFRFNFQRERLVDAPNSTGTLPAPMTLTAPTAGMAYSAQNGVITVRWSDSGSTDTMAAEFLATCRTFTGSKPADASFVAPLQGDTGVALINLGDYDDELASNCSVYDTTFTLRRSRDGTLDKAWGPTDACEQSTDCVRPATWFYLRQVRAVAIVLNHSPS